MTSREVTPIPEPEKLPVLDALILRLVLALLAGGTGALWLELRPMLVLIAGAGGGVLAQHLFALVRSHVRLNTWVLVQHAYGKTAIARGIGQVLQWVLYDRRYSSLTVAALGAILSAAASAILSYVAGEPLNSIVSGVVSFIVAQLLYAVRRMNTPDNRVVV